MHPLERHKAKSAITYPAVRDWAFTSGLTLDELICGLEEVMVLTYGNRPALLDRQTKHHYLAVQGFFNVLQQLSLLRERDVYALGQRCPVRMRRYDEALAATINMAKAKRVNPEAIMCAVELHLWHHRVTEEVLRWYQGLS